MSRGAPITRGTVLPTANPKPAPTRTYSEGAQAFEYRIVCSRRRRRTISISVDAEQGVTVATPSRATLAEVEAVLIRHALWVRRQLAALPPSRCFQTGDLLPYQGDTLRLELVESGRTKPKAVREVERLVLEMPAGVAPEVATTVIREALGGWYRSQASACYPARAAHWAAASGLHPKAVLVRAQRQRWGSCSGDGTLRLNWRLMLAPLEVLDYVIVHELAHLRVQSHAPAFWAEVALVLPGYREQRRWLRQRGPSLWL